MQAFRVDIDNAEKIVRTMQIIGIKYGPQELTAPAIAKECAAQFGGLIKGYDRQVRDMAGPKARRPDKRIQCSGTDPVLFVLKEWRKKDIHRFG